MNGVQIPAARRWPRWLLIAALAGPVLEVIVLVLVGRAVGFWPTLGLLVAIAVIGGVLVAREWPRTWRSLRESLAIGRPVEVDGVRLRKTGVSGDEVATGLADGALVLIGSLLLLAPGFLTDVLGIVCLFPPTRPLPRRLLLDLIARRTAWVGARLRHPGGLRGEVIDPTHPRARGSIEGTVIRPPKE